MARLVELDLMKIVGAFAVVLGHIANPLNSFIYLWHIPLFFFISGCTLDTKNNLLVNTTKDFKRLIIPFFIFSVIGIVSEIIKRVALGRDLEDFLTTIISSFVFFNSKSAHHYGFVLWFLPALFFSKLLVRCTLHIGAIFSIIFALCGLFVINTFIPNGSIILPFALQQSIQILPFIVFGYIFINSVNGFSKQLCFFCGTFILVLFSLGFIFSKFPSIDIGSGRMPFSLMALVGPLSLCLALYFLSTALCYHYKIKWVTWFSPSVMLIFIVHPYTNNISFILVEHLFYTFELRWLLVLFFSLLFIFPILYLKNKYPKLGFFSYV